MLASLRVTPRRFAVAFGESLTSALRAGLPGGRSAPRD